MPKAKTYRIQLLNSNDGLIMRAQIEGKRINFDSLPAFMAFVKNAIEKGESITISGTEVQA